MGFFGWLLGLLFLVAAGVAVYGAMNELVLPAMEWVQKVDEVCVKGKTK